MIRSQSAAAVLGEDHPDTLRSAHNLAIRLAELGGARTGPPTPGRDRSPAPSREPTLIRVRFLYSSIRQHRYSPGMTGHLRLEAVTGVDLTCPYPQQCGRDIR